MGGLGNQGQQCSADGTTGGPSESVPARGAAPPAPAECTPTSILGSASGGDELLDQIRQIKAHDVPEDVEVNLVVPVDQAVPHPHNLTPWDGRMGATELIRELARGLADDLDQSGQRQVEKAVGVQIGADAPAASSMASRA